jgi:hypothetical protein
MKNYVTLLSFIGASFITLNSIAMDTAEDSAYTKPFHESAITARRRIIGHETAIQAMVDNNARNPHLNTVFNRNNILIAEYSRNILTLAADAGSRVRIPLHDIKEFLKDEELYNLALKQVETTHSQRSLNVAYKHRKQCTIL